VIDKSRPRDIAFFIISAFERFNSGVISFIFPPSAVFFVATSMSF